VSLELLFCLFLAVLGIELRASHLLGKYSTLLLKPFLSPTALFFFLR
jgi:hypothetical protein